MALLVGRSFVLSTGELGGCLTIFYGARRVTSGLTHYFSWHSPRFPWRCNLPLLFAKSFLRTVHTEQARQLSNYFLQRSPCLP